VKIEETSVDSFSFGQQETSVARIQASAKAFEILSSSLYSNSILAIIRELCANAKDSHTAAGKKDIPFFVQCPNDLDPQFKVRDYGVGMSHEFVMTRVNTYFDSTKNDSNDEIGGFGLGIKSVFSYTSSFMITCYDGAARRVYAYKIGSTGLPEISFLAETPSDEEQGVEVSVPVMRDDYAEFNQNLVESLTFYNPRPQVIGINEDKFNITKIYEGSNWTIYKNPGNLIHESYVVMGDVIYPIPDSRYENSGFPINTYSLASHQARNRGTHNTVVVVYTAGIGDIDITPNREQIKLTPKSKEQIKAFEKVVQDELGTQIQKYVSEFTCSYWDMIRDESVNALLRSTVLHKFGVSPSKIKYHGLTLDVHQSISYTKKNSKVADKVKAVHSVESYYDELNIRDGSWSHGFGIVFDIHNLPHIVVADTNFIKSLSFERITTKFGNRPKLWAIHCERGAVDDVIADLNKAIPDFSDRIIKWSDLKTELDQIEIPSRYREFVLVAEAYYGGDNKPINFNVADFDDMVVIHYELQTEDGQRRNQACYSSLTGMFNYMSKEVVDLIKKNGIESVYALTQEQVDQLVAAGKEVKQFKQSLEPVLTTLATEFANNRPTMTLKEYLKPITDKNRRICLSTHYRAVKRWVNESGNTDLLNTLRLLNDESSSSYHRSTQDAFFKAITRSGIKEYIAANNIVPTKVTTNDVIKDLVTKAPLCARLVSDYTDQDVIDYVMKAMGWSTPAPKVKKPKVLKTIAVPVAQPVMAITI
jgi:hypothetical protein